MNLEFKQAVDECIEWMRAGATLESCLARYPQYAKDLKPILQTGQNLQTLDVPLERIESVHAGRQRLLNAYAKKANVQPVSRSSFSRSIQQILTKITGKDDINMRLVAAFALAILLVVGLILGGGVTATASASALPGDTLYPLKLSLENINLNLANDPQVRQQLEQQYQADRIQEVQFLLKLGRQTDINFIGMLSAANQDSWIIGGLSVKLDSYTQINGSTTIGAVVNVEGQTRSDGSILARVLTILGQTPMVPTPISTSPAYPGSGPMQTTTPMPTQAVTQKPGITQTSMPSHQATPMPTMMATQMPTTRPSMMPTHMPTTIPSMVPTHVPTSMPTMKATQMPTTMPTHQPTSMPTIMSTQMPTSMPTMMGGGHGGHP